MSRSVPVCACHEQVGAFDLDKCTSNMSATKLRCLGGSESRNCALLYGTLFMGTCIAKLCMIWFFCRSDRVRRSLHGQLEECRLGARSDPITLAVFVEGRKPYTLHGGLAVLKTRTVSTC